MRLRERGCLQFITSPYYRIINNVSFLENLNLQKLNCSVKGMLYIVSLLKLKQIFGRNSLTVLIYEDKASVKNVSIISF